MINSYKFDYVQEIKRLKSLLSYNILDTPPKEEYDDLQVLRLLKSNNRTKNIPVVMMPSSKEDKDIVESHRLGVTGYIVKSVQFENFSKTVSYLG